MRNINYSSITEKHGLFQDYWDSLEAIVETSEALECDPSVDIVSLDHRMGITESKTSDEIFTEAVFISGKETLKPLIAKIQKAKDILDEQTEEQENSAKEAAETRKSNRHAETKVAIPKIKKFDPEAYWKNAAWKDLEDEIGKIFGFRNVEIHPYIEKYNSHTKEFESTELNCMIYHSNRFPIEGLVTEKGFYDKSRSLTLQLHISLGLVKKLDADEILAVLLHEFGHGIDPALVDIKYTQVNIISKYLTDRKGALNTSEKKFLDKHKVSFEVLMCLFYVGVLLLFGVGKFIKWLTWKFGDKDKIINKKLEKVRKMVDEDKSKFNRQNFSEAYADNFARMYGYGPQLMSALKKMSQYNDKLINSRHRKELSRQEAIIYITSLMLKDVHKTDLHRIRSLIKEYKDDINDPNTPPVVKKQLKEDLTELEKILDEYINNFSDFQSRVNKVINEELEKIEVRDEKKKAKESAEKKENKPTEKKNENEDKKPEEEKEAALVKEGFEFFDESKKAYEELRARENTVTSKERAEFYKKFGHSKKCSFAKDEDGYYCYTHRCRSKSYKAIDDIPKKDVEFVRSTC